MFTVMSEVQSATSHLILISIHLLGRHGADTFAAVLLFHPVSSPSCRICNADS